MSTFNGNQCIHIKYCSASDDVINLMDLSMKLKKLIKKPEGTTPYILENLECFLDGFRSYSDKVFANDSEAISDYDLMEQEEGPHHLKLFPIEMMPLLNYYDWDSYDCWLFGGYLEKTKQIWYRLSEYMEARKRTLMIQKRRERKMHLDQENTK
ncbi:uncharacterized protein LOC124366395 [Homalodisca vitripennis]|uniref:uncharacterized protein LOC124366395 n=1 Tax=Homalodisca vitripennis TaxID=197043 RepID=UPI001EECB760|nr:uncharacterized protein LOC124366395 [Homalodisca vitripennis]